MAISGAVGNWQSRGQGFESPQLHQAQRRTPRASRSERSLLRIFAANAHCAFEREERSWWRRSVHSYSIFTPQVLRPHDLAQPSASQRTLRASEGSGLPRFSSHRSTRSAQSKGWVDVSRITLSQARGWCITPFRPRKYQENGFGHCYQKEANWPLRSGFMSGAEGIRTPDPLTASYLRHPQSPMAS